MQSNPTSSITLINNRYANSPDECDYSTTHQAEQNHDSDHSIIHHSEQIHNSEIIEGSQVANISQELHSSLEGIPSTMGVREGKN